MALPADQPRSTAVEVAWITGASSGMGKATAIALSNAGYSVALTGRRADELEQLAGELSEGGGSALAVPADVTDHAAVTDAVARIESSLGPVSHAVFAAGLNVVRRHWADLDVGEFDQILKVNLSAVASGIAAVLPGMRQAGSGQIVVVSSWAGWAFAPGAGVAYSASKTALRTITETVNEEESRHGIRACHLCPGDVDTPFLEQRPVVPDAAARARMLKPEDVAHAVRFVVDSPPHVRINELVISPTWSPPYPSR